MKMYRKRNRNDNVNLHRLYSYNSQTHSQTRTYYESAWRHTANSSGSKKSCSNYRWAPEKAVCAVTLFSTVAWHRVTRRSNKPACSLPAIWASEFVTGIWVCSMETWRCTGKGCENPNRIAALAHESVCFSANRNRNNSGRESSMNALIHTILVSNSAVFNCMLHFVH